MPNPAVVRWLGIGSVKCAVGMLARMQPGSYRILVYDYVPDIMELRGPHRPGHLENIREHVDSGAVLIAGAVGDPPHGGSIVFADVPDEVIEGFVANDPYVAAGLVSSWRIVPWTVVATAWTAAG